MDGAVDPGGSEERPGWQAPGWAIVASLALTGTTSAFMYTLVVPLQGELPTLLNASREDSAWVVTITLLVAAVATPISGRLGDMYGKRRVILALLVLLMIGSAIAALSGSITGVIVGRGMQGFITGVIPLGIAIMRDLLPKERLGTAVALMSATMGVGGALGMPIAAYIAHYADFHTLFWVAGGIGALCFAAVALCVPGRKPSSPARLDVLGVLGLATGLTGLLLYVSRGAEWGWVSLPSLVALGLGTVVLLSWGFYQLRRRDPLVDLRRAAGPRVLFANLTGFSMAFALFTAQVTFPQLLELPSETGVGFGLTMFQAALCIMPSGLIMIFLAPLSGWLERTIGPRLLLALGTIAMIVSYSFIMLLSSEVWHFVVANVLIGVAIAFSFAAMSMIIMSAVPASETGVSNGLNALFRSVGTSGAAAVMGGVLAAMSTADGPSRAAFDLCFQLAIVAAFVSLVLALLVPRAPLVPGGAAIDDPL